MKKFLLAIVTVIPALLSAQTVSSTVDRRVGDAAAITTFNTAVTLGNLVVGETAVRSDSAIKTDNAVFGQYTLGVGRASVSVNGQLAVQIDKQIDRDVTPAVLPEDGFGGQVSLPLTEKTNVFVGGQYARYSDHVPTTTAQLGLAHDSVLHGTVGLYGQYTSITNTFRPQSMNDLGLGVFFNRADYRLYASSANEYVDSPFRFLRVTKAGVSTALPLTTHVKLVVSGEVAKWDNTFGVYNIGTGLSVGL